MEALGQEDATAPCIRISKEESDIVSEMSGPFNEASSVEKGETSNNPREQTRRGSTCKQIRPLPTFVKSESHCENDCDRMNGIVTLLRHRNICHHLSSKRL